MVKERTRDEVLLAVVYDTYATWWLIHANSDLLSLFNIPKSNSYFLQYLWAKYICQSKDKI